MLTLGNKGSRPPAPLAPTCFSLVKEAFGALTAFLLLPPPLLCLLPPPLPPLLLWRPAWAVVQISLGESQVFLALSLSWAMPRRHQDTGYEGASCMFSGFLGRAGYQGWLKVVFPQWFLFYLWGWGMSLTSFPLACWVTGLCMLRYSTMSWPVH